MFKIGAFSKLVNVSARMLRHYEKCGLLYPIQFDKVNGCRYYSASQIPLLDRITSLRDMRFTIAEISDILDNYDDGNYIESMIMQKTHKIKGQILEFQDQLNRMEGMEILIGEGNHADPVKVEIKSIPSYPVISLRKTLPDYSEQNNLWQLLFAFINKNNIYSVLSGQLFCIYHSEGYIEKNVDIEVCAIVNKPIKLNGDFTFRYTDEIPLAATAVFTGFYSDMALWEGIIAKWVEDNEYEAIGCEQFYCIDHYLNCEDINRYKTEIQLPIRKL